MRGFLIFSLLGLALAALCLPARAAQGKAAATDILVKLRPGLQGAAAEAVHQRMGGRLKRNYSHVGWQQISLPAGMTVSEAVNRYRRLAEVLQVEPNYEYRTFVTPNDPRMGQLWGMTKIQAPAAWDSGTGSADVVVAVIDTGINYNHEDLRNNMWRNPGEIAGNRVDDDNNGYVDDIYGLDTYNDDGDPLDDAGHGTHVAGTIGAAGNNGLGVAGVNWTVKLMALKFLGANGSGYTSDAIAAYNYLIAMKRRGVNVRAVNNSWGGGGYSQALKDAIDTAGSLGIVSACAAGNSNVNIDASRQYPAAYTSESLISVAASDSSDRRASFSNYGVTNVDLAAPGVSITSTYHSSPSAYASMSGTSMATPHVAGAVALLAAKNGGLTAGQLKSALMSTVDQLPAWAGVVASGGRMNLSRAMASVGGGPVTPPPPPPPASTYQPDAMIRTNAASVFVGDNVYSTGGNQTVSQSTAINAAAIYQLKVQNDGNTSDTLIVTVPAASGGWTVRVFNAPTGGTDITAQATGAGWQTGVLAAGAVAQLRLEITPGSSMTAGATYPVTTTTRSQADGTKTDAAVAVTSVPAPTTKKTASLALTPTSPQPAGTELTLTATSTGGPAEYLFQIGTRTTTGSWRFTTLRNFSAVPTATWRPTNAGIYAVRLITRWTGGSTYLSTTQYYTVTAP